MNMRRTGRDRDSKGRRGRQATRPDGKELAGTDNEGKEGKKGG